MRARDLIGRTIVAVDFNVFQTGVGQEKSTKPVITLDNGRKLLFVVSETESGEYGVEMHVTKKPEGTKK
jgi:hypothetical protein